MLYLLASIVGLILLFAGVLAVFAIIRKAQNTGELRRAEVRALLEILGKDETADEAD